MKKITLCLLAVLLCGALSYADDRKPGITISFNSDDPRIHLGDRHNPRDARLAITTRDGSVELLLLHDVVAVQLTDRTLANVAAKDDEGFLEAIVGAAVRTAVRKPVDYPLANIRSVDIRDGVLVLINDRNQPVFADIKVNGSDVLRGFSLADATRFVNAFRAARNVRH